MDKEKTINFSITCSDVKIFSHYYALITYTKQINADIGYRAGMHQFAMDMQDSLEEDNWYDFEDTLDEED